MEEKTQVIISSLGVVNSIELTAKKQKKLNNFIKKLTSEEGEKVKKEKVNKNVCKNCKCEEFIKVPI